MNLTEIEKKLNDHSHMEYNTEMTNEDIELIDYYVWKEFLNHENFKIYEDVKYGYFSVFDNDEKLIECGIPSFIFQYNDAQFTLFQKDNDTVTLLNQERIEE